MALVDRSLEHALRAFARRHRLTLFTLMESAWALLVSHYSGTRDVVFGTISSGRTVGFDGIEQMTGSFNNMVPIRIGLPDGEPVSSWLRGVQTATMAATRFEQTSLVDVHRAVGFPADRLLLESYLVFENFPMGKRMQEMDTEWKAGDEGATQTEHPLRVFIWPVGTFTVEISYYDNVLSTETIKQVLAKYMKFLRCLLDGAQESVGCLLAELE